MLQRVGVFSPYFPEVRTRVPLEYVQGVAFGEDLGPISLERDPVVRAHVVAELVSVEVRPPGVHEGVGRHPARFSAGERREVREDIAREVIPFRFDDGIMGAWQRYSTHR